MVKIIKRGGIGVIPTDTLYGIVGLALSKKAVSRIYRVRGRNPKKPFIILIGSIADLKRFGIRVNSEVNARVLNKVWPGPVSVILPCPSKKFTYLHRGTKTLAFRVPKTVWLRAILKKTGPLVAPSANPEGKATALTVAEARTYFGSRVDFYLDRGRRNAQASNLLEIKR